MGQMATKTKLEVLSRSPFDKSYIKGMVKDHEDDIKEFQKEATSGQDLDAKAYAAATLPTLKAHLKKIQSIASSQGVSALIRHTASVAGKMCAATSLARGSSSGSLRSGLSSRTIKAAPPSIPFYILKPQRLPAVR
jgi:hypothetical protein